MANPTSAIPGGQATARRPLFHSPQDMLLLGVILLVGAVFFGVYLLGQLAGLVGRLAWPHGNLGAGFSILARLPRHWSDPKLAYPAAARNDLPGLPGFIAATLLLLAVVFAAAVVLARRGGRSRPAAGYATLVDLDKALSVKAVLAKGEAVRPSLKGTKFTLADVGVQLGDSIFHKRPLGVTMEASVLLAAAPRQGKTSQVVIPWLTTWPGPAVVTSVRADVLAATHQPRAERGPVYLMDPTGEITWPDMLAWSPTSGCASYKTALERAEVLVTVGKGENQDSDNAAFFGMSATNLLATWLHAAALDARTMDEVLAWAFNDSLTDPVRILRQYVGRGAYRGVVEMLSNLYDNAAPQTKASLWATVQTGLAPLMTEAARATFSPKPEDSLDIEAFLASGGTIYLMSTEKAAGKLAPLIATFVDEVALCAKRLGMRRPGGRLDPVLGLFLDEIANVVPLPNLPVLMSTAGGSGIFVVAVFQSLAQAEQRWGRYGAQMLWGAATVKIALAGLAGEELEMFSKLAGTYREQLTSSQSGNGGGTLSTTLADRPTASPDRIRTLQPGEAFVLEATTAPVIVRMPRHFDGPNQAAHERSIAEFEYLTGLRLPAHEPQDEPRGQDGADR